jgi:hypothetical protein
MNGGGGMQRVERLAARRSSSPEHYCAVFDRPEASCATPDKESGAGPSSHNLQRPSMKFHAKKRVESDQTSGGMNVTGRCERRFARGEAMATIPYDICGMSLGVFFSGYNIAGVRTRGRRREYESPAQQVLQTGALSLRLLLVLLHTESSAEADDLNFDCGLVPRRRCYSGVIVG